MKKFLVPFVVLALFGFGCSPTPASKPEAVPVKPTTPTAAQPNAEQPTAVEPGETQPTASGEVKTLTAAVTDDTWKTYTSKSLGFSFQWPTKGRYAPEWEVKASPTSSSQGSCVENEGEPRADSPQMVKTSQTEFCHTGSINGVVGTGYFLDTYAAVIGKTLVKIQFSKKVTSVGEVGCTGKIETEYSASPTTCVPFVIESYNDTLNGIVGTFKME